MHYRVSARRGPAGRWGAVVCVAEGAGSGVPPGFASLVLQGSQTWSPSLQWYFWMGADGDRGSMGIVCGETSETPQVS